MLKFKIKDKKKNPYVRTMPEGDPYAGQHWCDACRMWVDNPEAHRHGS